MEYVEIAVAYIVNYETMMLKPDLKTGQPSTIVWEESHKLCVKENVQKILDNSCIVYGASFNGRREFSRSFLRTDKKLPIEVISPARSVMFPLRSNTTGEKIWLAYHHVKDQQPISPGRMEILFTDNSTCTVDISEASFARQYNLAARMVNRNHYL